MHLAIRNYSQVLSGAGPPSGMSTDSSGPQSLEHLLRDRSSSPSLPFPSLPSPSLPFPSLSVAFTVPFNLQIRLSLQLDENF